MTILGLILGRGDAALIEAEAKRAWPREACGLLIGAADAAGLARVTRVVPAQNVAETSRPDRFEIDPALVLRLHRELRGTAEALIGHYHSHPDGRAIPSASDAAEAAWPGLVWLIVGLAGAEKASMAAFLHPEGMGAPAPFSPLVLKIESALA